MFLPWAEWDKGMWIREPLEIGPHPGSVSDPRNDLQECGCSFLVSKMQLTVPSSLYCLGMERLNTVKLLVLDLRACVLSCFSCV